MIATGHYARVERGQEKDFYHLKKGIDESKDQSYFLAGLDQGQLSKVLFPIGGLQKSEVRDVARKV
jgi:tRNA-uridine 2-sulfurtransferase